MLAELGLAAGCDGDRVRLERLAESTQDLDGGGADRDVERDGAARVEVVRLEWPLAAVIAVIAVDPRRIRRIETTARVGHRHARRARGPVRTRQLDGQPTGRLQGVAFDHGKRPLGAARNRVQPELGAAAGIGDVCDRATVGRPACADRVEITVRDRQRVAAVERQQPQLMPVAT